MVNYATVEKKSLGNAKKVMAIFRDSKRPFVTIYIYGIRSTKKKKKKTCITSYFPVLVYRQPSWQARPLS